MGRLSERRQMVERIQQRTGELRLSLDALSQRGSFSRPIATRLPADFYLREPPAVSDELRDYIAHHWAKSDKEVA